MLRVFLSLFILIFPGFALPQEFVETHGDWSIYKFNNNGQMVCYIGTTPKQSKGNFKKRGNPYFLVTALPDHDEINASSGYYYKDQVKASLVIDGTKFDLMTRNKNAWTINPKNDADIISLLKKSSAFSLNGVSSRDTKSWDNFSSNGFEKAYNRIKEDCK